MKINLIMSTTWMPFITPSNTSCCEYSFLLCLNNSWFSQWFFPWEPIYKDVIWSFKSSTSLCSSKIPSSYLLTSFSISTILSFFLFMSISRCFILISLSSSILVGYGVLSSSSIASISSTYVSGNWLIGYSTIFSISVWPCTRADIFGATVCNCTFCDPVALFDLELLSVLTGHWSSSPFLQPGLYTLHSC